MKRKNNSVPINEHLANKIKNYITDLQRKGDIPNIRYIDYEVRYSETGSIYVVIKHASNGLIKPKTLRISNHPSGARIKDQYIVTTGMVSYSYLRRKIRSMIETVLRVGETISILNMEDKI